MLNRVKLHTNFSAPIEGGLYKMAVLGVVDILPALKGEDSSVGQRAGPAPPLATARFSGRGGCQRALSVTSSTVTVKPASPSASASGRPIPEAGVRTPPASGESVSPVTRQIALSPIILAVAP